MQLRWFPFLAGLLVSLGGAACSAGDDDADDDVGRGGSAGSSAGTGGASGGSETFPPPMVGLQLALHSPNTPTPNTECFPAGVSEIGNPPPTLNPLSPGGRVADGDSDLSVTCSVLGPDTFNVEAVIDQGSLRFRVSNGTIDAAAGTGTFRLLVDTEEAGNIATEAEQPCTFDVSEPPLEVSEGNLFATFECPVLWNHETATDTACGADGALVLEFCTPPN
jgi:hypothetical protein